MKIVGIAGVEVIVINKIRELLIDDIDQHETSSSLIELKR